METEKPIRYATVCSGVEAMSLAVSGMDWKPVFFSEIEPFPCKLLKHRFPAVPNVGDMTKIKGEDYYGAIDVLAGGTPCQSFSVAGKRGGLGDKRGNLMLKFAELAYTTGAKWFVWENVPGVLSSGNGADFGCLLSSLAGWDVPTPAEGWRSSGIVQERPGHFGLAWRILDAQYTRTQRFPRAVPQRRRRVWVVGYFGSWTHSAQVLLESPRLLENTPPRRKTWQSPSAGVAFGPGGAKQTNVASTLDCKCKDGPIRNQEGMGICDLCIAGDIARGAHEGQNGTGISETGASFTLNTIDIPAICQPVANVLETSCGDYSRADGFNMVIAYENHANDSRVTETGDMAPTIAGNAGTGGGNLPLVMGTFIKERHDKFVQGESASTLRAHEGKEFSDLVVLNDQGGSVMELTDNFTGTLRAQIKGHEPIVMGFHPKPSAKAAGLGCAEELAPTLGTCDDHAVLQRMAVRRLTPTECERLMGFPDGWTNISNGNKPTPDSVRYKACGNSWAVNEAEWVMSRIDKLERTA